jgi:membrane associated rhomboid family serine protease
VRDGLSVLGAFLLAVICCALPLLILGGLGVLGGIAWGRAVAGLVGAGLLVLALGRAAAVTRARARNRGDREEP